MKSWHFRLAKMSFIAEFKRRAKALRAETFALYLAARDPRTPWYAKALVAGIVAYAFSPIDLIPDFVPVFGYVDDLILIPIGIAFTLKLIPPEVMTECRARAAEALNDHKLVSRTAGALIIAIWIILAALGILWGYELISK